MQTPHPEEIKQRLRNMLHIHDTDIGRRVINLYSVFNPPMDELTNLCSGKEVNNGVVEQGFVKMLDLVPPHQRFETAKKIWHQAYMRDGARYLSIVSMRYIGEHIDEVNKLGAYPKRHTLKDIIVHGDQKYAKRALEMLADMQPLDAAATLAEMLIETQRGMHLAIDHRELVKTAVLFTRHYVKLEDKDMARHALGLLGGHQDWNGWAALYVDAEKKPYNLMAREELAKIPAPVPPKESELLKAAFQA
jgi:hypothetical protein